MGQNQKEKDNDQKGKDQLDQKAKDNDQKEKDQSDQKVKDNDQKGKDQTRPESERQSIKRKRINPIRK